MSGQTLLALPHHDGSERYVSQSHPRLGDTVTLHVRIPHAAEVSSLHLRTTPDAEPAFTAGHIDRRTDADTWWSVPMAMHNPVMNYRFLLQGGPLGYQWLNGCGLHDRDVPDAADFRITTFGAPPAWSRDAVVYQVFPDRFARSAAASDRPVPDWASPASWDDDVVTHGPLAGAQLFGGDLDGIVDHLDHLLDLGVTTLYLTPIFPGRSNHRYDASTFESVDPILGGEEALTRLVDAAHERGLRVLGDFTTNHTGAAHPWFVRARDDADSVERGFYFFEGDGYASWLDVPSLPKLNYDSAELARRLFDDDNGVVRHFLAGPSGFDGWRVDVANMTGRYRAQDHNRDVARAMRSAVETVRPDGLLVGEHCHDFTNDALGDGWHGVMNYSGFTRPVWTWLRHPGHAPQFLGSPLMVPRLDGVAVMETMRDFASLVPWNTVVHSFNLVGSHDTTRIRSLVGDDVGQVDVAAGLLFTMPGIPMVAYGDEIGMRGESGEGGRRPMPWGSEDDDDLWDERLRGVYRDLIAARKASAALRRGGLRWLCAGEDHLIYLRESRDETALVHVARLAHDPVRLALADLPGIETGRAAYGRTPAFEGSELLLSADGPHVGIWTWAPTE